MGLLGLGMCGRRWARGGTRQGCGYPYPNVLRKDSCLARRELIVEHLPWVCQTVLVEDLCLHREGHVLCTNVPSQD